MLAFWVCEFPSQNVDSKHNSEGGNGHLKHNSRAKTARASTSDDLASQHINGLVISVFARTWVGFTGFVQSHLIDPDVIQHIFDKIHCISGSLTHVYLFPYVFDAMCFFMDDNTRFSLRDNNLGIVQSFEPELPNIDIPNALENFPIDNLEHRLRQLRISRDEAGAYGELVDFHNKVRQVFNYIIDNFFDFQRV